MPKAYIVTCYRSISDPQKLAAYGQLAPAAVAAFGGRILARGNAVAAYEHGLRERTVIAEFPSLGEGHRGSGKRRLQGSPESTRRWRRARRSDRRGIRISITQGDA